MKNFLKLIKKILARLLKRFKNLMNPSAMNQTQGEKLIRYMIINETLKKI